MSAHIIKQILRLQEGKHDIVVRVSCPLCNTNYTLMLIGRTGRYECRHCHKQGKLSELLVYFEDRFECRHRDTIGTMTERDGVDL